MRTVQFTAENNLCISCGIWRQCLNDLEYRDVGKDQIIKSQLLQERAQNINFAHQKEEEIEEQEGIILDINGFGMKGTQPEMNNYKAQMMKIYGGYTFAA